MKENQIRHVCFIYIYSAYSIGSKASAYRKSIVAAQDIWKQMNVAKRTIRIVLRTKNYQCSQAVIGQLCIVSYRWLDNSRMSTIIIKLKSVNLTMTPKWDETTPFGISHSLETQDRAGCMHACCDRDQLLGMVKLCRWVCERECILPAGESWGLLSRACKLMTPKRDETTTP